jgi:hypothetical protein
MTLVPQESGQNLIAMFGDQVFRISAGRPRASLEF